MGRDWESWLATASGPASPTEEQERDRTERRIKDAIRSAVDLPNSVRIYAKGSYANGTNVRRNADVDIAVEWTETAKVMRWGETLGRTAADLGYMPVEEPISPSEFRRRIERALVAQFDYQVDVSPDKHIGVEAGAGTLDADVVPCFKLHRYDAPYDFKEGHRIYPNGGGYVDNYPQQNYDNGVAKNTATGRRYKEIVRCCKRLFHELHEIGKVSQDYPGYLTESLLYNVPNPRFGHPRRLDDMREVFGYLWNGLRDSDVYNTWTEPSGLKMIFRGRPDRVPANALRIVDRAWDEIGIG